MRKVLYVSGTRADYGLMRTTLRAIAEHPSLDLVIVAAGMHLMPDFGDTVEEIRKDGFRVMTAGATIESDRPSATPHFLGRLTMFLSEMVEREAPDEILLLGDRAEMLAGAIVGTYMRIPTFHVHGGDVSSTVDEHVRHAITKLSHVHLAATERSANRILRMGESPEEVFVVGSPAVDDLVRMTPDVNVPKRYGLEPQGYVILVQHPVSGEEEQAGMQIAGTIEAVLERRLASVIVYPNSDAGGRRIIDSIEAFDSPLIHRFRSLPRDHYLQLLLQSRAIIGNSSSGLAEAPSLGVPFINVGTRQSGRERGDNVIDVGYGKEEVLRGLDLMNDPEFKRRVVERRSPYGDGCTAARIAALLAEKPLTPGLTQKRLPY